MPRQNMDTFDERFVDRIYDEMMREERRSGSTELRRKYAGTAASEAAAHEDYRSEKEVYSLLSHEYVAGHTSSRSPYRAVRRGGAASAPPTMHEEDVMRDAAERWRGVSGLDRTKPASRGGSRLSGLLRDLDDVERGVYPASWSSAEFKEWRGLHAAEPVEQWREWKATDAAYGTRERYEAWLAMRNAFSHWRREAPGIAAADELDSRLQFELRVSGAFRLWWIYAQTQHVARQLERGYLEEIERALADC